MTALCASPRCRITGQHRPDCDDVSCRGCLPRTADRPPYCDACRDRLAWHLADIDSHYRHLLHHALELDTPWMVTQYAFNDHGVLGPIRDRGHDPVAGQLPAYAPPRTGHAPRVSGSRQPPTPADLDEVDLTLPARPGARALFARGLLGLDVDQRGTLSIATVLDTWVREWNRRRRHPRRLPLPTVPDLVDWLQRSLPAAINHDLNIASFEIEIADAAYALRQAVDPRPPRPERIIGVPCRGCDTMSLFRGHRYAAECGACGLLYAETEYAQWVADVAANVDPALAPARTELRSGVDGWAFHPAGPCRRTGCDRTTAAGTVAYCCTPCAAADYGRPEPRPHSITCDERNTP